MDYAREWAVRIVHEAQMHECNAFITLTYNDQHLPADQSLKLSDYQQFMKRLRRRIAPTKIRFFHCGEYGGKYGRPHYHAIIFGYDFPDKVLHAVRRENPVYRSKLLEETWGKGFSEIGTVTYQSAAYVGRYIMKKMYGPMAVEKYGEKITDDGEIVNIKRPEYTTMSRMPGIGQEWFLKYYDDVFPCDFVVIEGKQHPVPRYYEKMWDRVRLDRLSDLKAKRRKKAKLHASDHTSERLKIREKCQIKRLEELPRNLGEEDGP